MAETVNPADWGATQSGGADPAQWGAKPISMDQLHALWEGVKSGVTAGFSDELTGLYKAGGIPKALEGDARTPLISPVTSAIVGGARLAYEKLAGQSGEASERYDLDATRHAPSKKWLVRNIQRRMVLAKSQVR